MSDFSALNTSVTGLFAHRQRIDTIAENISNVDTPGYHRQRVQLTAIGTSYPGLFSGPGGEHGGVSADVTRQWDRLLAATAQQEQSRSRGLDTQAGILDGIEATIGTLGPGNLASRLQQLWNSFDDLANDPSDLAVRNVVLGHAEGVAAELQTQAAALDRIHSYETARLTEGVERVNTLAATIADLDRTIVAGTAAGSPPNALMDQRDRLISELSSLVDAEVAHESNGQVRISIDGHMMVSQGQARTIQMTSTPDPALASLGYERLAVTSSTGRELTLGGGSIGGGLVGVNQLIPQQRRALDEVAASIVTTVNTLHQGGSALDGSTGLSFFDPLALTAAGIRLSADVAGQPHKVAASDGSGTLDNTIARSLAQLGSSPTGPSSVHARMVADLGTRLASTRSRAEAAAMASQQAEGSRQAAVGVNLDEELADLVSAQRAYEASARMVSAIDEMLDTLINRTGLVGR